MNTLEFKVINHQGRKYFVVELMNEEPIYLKIFSQFVSFCGEIGYCPETSSQFRIFVKRNYRKITEVGVSAITGMATKKNKPKSMWAHITGIECYFNFNPDDYVEGDKFVIESSKETAVPSFVESLKKWYKKEESVNVI